MDTSFCSQNNVNETMLFSYVLHYYNISYYNAFICRVDVYKSKSQHVVCQLNARRYNCLNTFNTKAFVIFVQVIKF